MDAGKREEFRRAQRSANGPAWRSKAAQAMTKPDCNDAQIWDRLTIDAAKNHALRAAGASDKERADAFPLIEATMTLQNDANKTEVIKLMILVDSPIGAIAEKVGITPEVAEIWDLLHFDVRQMQGATSWLSIHVVDGECKAGNTALAARMKLALVAGVEGVNAMLDMDAGVPIDEAHRLFQRRLNLELKLDAAANAPTHTERSRMAFIRLYADLQLAQQRLDLANKKLAARCAEARNRYDLAKIQIENLRERQAVTANK
ncbi:MAG: hypothetical protein ACXW4Z_10455, partial [Candidatus Binatia bacterium]